MAKNNRTTSTPPGASVAKIAFQERPYFNVMDSLNQAIADLRATVQALYAVDTHINDGEDNAACRDVLSRLLMADLGLVEDAERRAWAEIIVRKGGDSERPSQGQEGQQPVGPPGSSIIPPDRSPWPASRATG